MDLDSASREALMTEVLELRAHCEAGAELMQAAKARVESDTATIQSLTDWRDQWRAQAEALQAEIDDLRQQLKAARTRGAARSDRLGEQAESDQNVQPAAEVEVPSVAPERDRAPQQPAEATAVDAETYPAEPAAPIDRVGVFTTLAEVAVDSEGDQAAEAIAAYGFDPQDTGANVAPVEVLPEAAPTPPRTRGRLSRLRG